MTTKDWKIALEVYKQQRKLISVYLIQDDASKFNVGVVLQVTETDFCLAEVTRYGEDAGFGCYRIEDIAKISVDGVYEIGLQCMCHENNLQPKGFPETEDIFQSMLETAHIQRDLVEIATIRDDVIIGIVRELTESLCQIKEYDDYGNRDGFTMIPIEHIRSVEMGSRHLQKIKTLATAANQ